VSLMAVFEVVRHTRAQEEEGRVELLRSAVVGRYATAVAAMAVAATASLVLGLGLALATWGASVPAADALLYGASVAALGVFFAAAALCAAQVFTHPRAASGVTLAVFGVAYVVRGAGDVQENGLVWLSPIGWSQATHPLGDARWWPLLVPLVLSAGLVALAVGLTAHRDLGAGLVSERPGSPAASRWLAGPVGLAWRTQRAYLAGWLVGMFVLGATYGSLTQGVQDLAEGNPTLEEFFKAAGAGSIVDSFLGTMLLILALLAGAYAASSAARLTSEETAGRLEVLLATGLSRTRWMLGTLAVTALGSVAVLLAGGLGMSTSYAVATSDAGQVVRLAALQLVYAPAVLLLAALAALVNGWAPGWTKVVWLVLAVWFVLGYLGPLLHPPELLVRLSPFTHTPQVPAEPLALAAPAVIAALGVLATAVGLVGFRRRDMR
jgi:ABC-2 type transport system permease protein